MSIPVTAVFRMKRRLPADLKGLCDQLIELDSIIQEFEARLPFITSEDWKISLTNLVVQIKSVLVEISKYIDLYDETNEKAFSRVLKEVHGVTQDYARDIPIAYMGLEVAKRLASLLYNSLYDIAFRNVTPEEAFTYRLLAFSPEVEAQKQMQRVFPPSRRF